MLGSSDLVAFAATAKPEASRTFYEDVLGLDLIVDEPTAIVFDAPNASVRISKVESVQPPDYTVLGWDVADLDSVVDALVEAGVELAQYDDLPQDERGVATFPDGTRVAWFEDPDGNTLSVTEHASER